MTLEILWVQIYLASITAGKGYQIARIEADAGLKDFKERFCKGEV